MAAQDLLVMKNNALLYCTKIPPPANERPLQIIHAHNLHFDCKGCIKPGINMATQAGFSDPSTSTGSARQGMVTFKSNLTPSTRGSNKRKRGNNDHGGSDIRDSSMSKRTNVNAFAQHPNDTSGGAPTVSMGDPHSDNLFAQAQSATDSDDQSAQHFDLSALQAHSQSASAQQAGAAASMDTATAAAALSQHYSMQVPPHPAESFMNEPTAGTADQAYSNLDNAQEYHGPDGDLSPDGTPGKPTVGSDEWHKQRKENHKEVERRRRETINEGINELAKIVPNCEKNKGSILARAVQYITKLHEDASQNIDKWTFEKLVTEQALTDLSGKLQRAWAEKEAWKRVAKDAGVDVDNTDLGLEAEEGDDGIDSSTAMGKSLDGPRDGQRHDVLDGET